MSETKILTIAIGVVPITNDAFNPQIFIKNGYPIYGEDIAKALSIALSDTPI